MRGLNLRRGYAKQRPGLFRRRLGKSPPDFDETNGAMSKKPGDSVNSNRSIRDQFAAIWNQGMRFDGKARQSVSGIVAKDA